ncbi:hypothetical protein H5410_003296 [Solanum commersonii]|uniref:Uncharacterized protein n=1 Tax=Solanum commersonii TaxID=4109 RepID=A0A9J6B4N7_SOLCO|nr:hypothetical protein H5410_003296 [Solanum commersonii]
MTEREVMNGLVYTVTPSVGASMPEVTPLSWARVPDMVSSCTSSCSPSVSASNSTATTSTIGIFPVVARGISELVEASISSDAL